MQKWKLQNSCSAKIKNDRGETLPKVILPTMHRRSQDFWLGGPHTSGGSRKFWWGGILRTNPQKFGCLHRNWEWYLGRNRKFERFFRPKSGGLQKKKKKKRSSPKLRVIFRPKPLALLLLYCLITVMCVITEKKLQLNIVRLCCHNFLSLVEFWLGGPVPPPLATPMRRCTC